MAARATPSRSCATRCSTTPTTSRLSRCWRARSAPAATTRAWPTSCGRASRTPSRAATRDTLADVALRLGALLDRWARRRAVDVYREALEHRAGERDRCCAPSWRSSIPRDDHARAAPSCWSRLLAVEEAGPRAGAGARARRPCGRSWATRERALEALELGPPRRVRTTRACTTGSSSGTATTSCGIELAGMLIGDAERATEIADGLARLRDAAAVFREQLGDMARAAEVLDRARALAPGDVELVIELAALPGRRPATLDGGVRLLTAQLDGKVSRAARVDLLLLRAELRTAARATTRRRGGRSGGRAPARRRARRAASAEALERQRERAESRDDREAERAASMRLARMMLDAGDEVAGARPPGPLAGARRSDRERCTWCCEMDAAAERWDGVVAVARASSTLDGGSGAGRRGRAPAEAGEKSGMVQVAQQGLEYVHQVQQDSVRVRELLRRIYERPGAYRELAGLLLADADHGG